MSLEIEKDERGYYSLCVWNGEDKSDEEIHEDFGKYGEIQNIHRSGNTLFLRFINYEDASSCCKAFQNHPVYRVKPARKKSSGFQRRDDGNYRSPGDDRSYQGSSPQDGRSRNADRGYQKRSNNASELPPLPKLRPACKSPVRDPSKPKPEIAKGVMIGNLHSEILQKDIYEMCHKAHAKPLHVDMKSFKPLHYRTIYYANVYVKTDDEVDKIIKGLNLRLNGLKLFVSSIDHMLQEAEDNGETVD